MEPSGYTVMILNLAPVVTTQDLREFLGFCGAIQHVEILRSEESTCIAYVTFKNQHAMESALLLNGSKLLSQPLTITQCNDYKGDSKLWRHSSMQLDNDPHSNNTSVTRRVSAIAASTVAELGHKTGLANKFGAGIEVARIADERYGIMDRTKSVVSVAGRTVGSAASAVISSRYFSRGALWLSSALGKASQITADLGNRGAGNSNVPIFRSYS